MLVITVVMYIRRAGALCATNSYLSTYQGNHVATKLKALLGILQGVKSTAKSRIDTTYKDMQKRQLFDGLARTYTPLNDDGEQLPDEGVQVQQRAEDMLDSTVAPWSRLLDVSASIDATNALAKAPLRVNGQEITPALPIATLLYLEKQLTDLRTMVAVVPTLDPAKPWVWSDSQDSYVSGPTATNKSKKVYRNHLVHEGNQHHAPQVHVFQEDIVVGTWSKMDYSAAVEATRKRAMLKRVDELLEATRVAREEANDQEVIDIRYAGPLFEYILEE